MTTVGPELPAAPSEKRKRDDHGSNIGSDSDSDTGPAPPAQFKDVAPKRPRVIGPSLPPPSALSSEPINRDSDTSSSNDDDDDDFGPSLPTSGTILSDSTTNTAAATHPEISDSSTKTTKRDDWMLVPPSGGDWSARIDPTKLKNRKFNTGKGAKGPSSTAAGTDSWHETPQEKQARLQREMMGIKDVQPKSTSSNQPLVDKADVETARKLQEYNKARGPTLYEAHQQNETEEKDDDPSARAFDREKDIGGGLQVNATQRRDMMRKAADFNSKFSSGKYL